MEGEDRMELEPETKELVDLITAQGRPPFADMTPAEFRSLLVAPPSAPADDEAIADVSDTVAAEVPIRIYRPHRPARGIMMYLHGGGFVVGSIDASDAAARAIVARTDLVLVSVGYRLAPENPFPAAVDDAWAVLDWIHQHRAGLAFDGAPLMVGGDSAGANLATGAAIHARDTGINLCFQLLFYPTTDCDFDRPSYHDHAEQWPLPREAMQWFWGHYGADEADWRACPLKAETLRGVAPAYIAVASHDPLRDEGLAYAKRLESDDVAVIVDDAAGLLHGYASMLRVSPGARAALDRGCAALRARLDIVEALTERLPSTQN
ncbi:acetyl esterase [Sphingomonas jinjuensis]|uniref:Acetyl esterase n=1 Tax=Sphingomonas jinjuensis TaxID=535907 RepID=A0A840FBQ3_9SPHN|nr:alpha/beta hydrolase [Sphingomonas jinjuensis]MBB4155079.1 acetyl esterase [Sphingomonas jinjuensis]